MKKLFTSERAKKVGNQWHRCLVTTMVSSAFFILLAAKIRKKFSLLKIFFFGLLFIL